MRTLDRLNEAQLTTVIFFANVPQKIIAPNTVAQDDAGVRIVDGPSRLTGQPVFSFERPEAARPRSTRRRATRPGATALPGTDCDHNASTVTNRSRKGTCSTPSGTSQ